MKPIAEKLSLSVIRTDAGTQTRVKLCEATVEEYADSVDEKAEFPPVVVFFDGSTYFLADGFHRYFAVQRNGLTEIAAEVHQGDRIAALKYALGANRANGLRRTNADKKRCVEMALAEFGKWSDRTIADMCGVHHETVTAARGNQLADSANSTRIGKDGKTYPAKKKSSEPKTELPTVDSESASGSDLPPSSPDAHIVEPTRANPLAVIPPGTLANIKADMNATPDEDVRSFEGHIEELIQRWSGNAVACSRFKIICEVSAKRFNKAKAD